MSLMSATAAGSSCFPPCTSASPTTRCGSGVVSVPTWSTCGSCTWRRPPWLLEAGESFDYAEVRDLAEPKVPEAPVLTLSGQSDLKIYDRLLMVSLATAGVCA